MGIELRNLKGTGDFMPQEQKIRQQIMRKLQEVFESYGYQPVETPVICYFDILASKYAGGAEILKEVYKLRDQGGREIGLRYDLTVPFAKVVGMNPEIRMPFKRYEIGKVYRDGPVKTGRNREFIQCDVDMVGVKSVMAEAELMMMAVEVYKLLGLDIYICYNNRKLLSGIIESVGIEPVLAPQVILTIDKIEKIGGDGVKSELSRLGIADSKINLLLNFMEMQPEELMSSFASTGVNEMIRQGKDELDELNSYLEALEIKASLWFRPSLARGLEIYTGTVWEVFLKDESITSSVGAGGRYDNIIGAFLDNGMKYPAVGMTFGLDVIYEAIMLKGSIEEKPPADVYIIPIGTSKTCLRLAAELRNAGLKADIEMLDRKLKKSLDFANRQGIPFVVIVGEDELKVGTVKLKDMAKGVESEIMMSDLVKTTKTLVARECI